MVGRLGRAAVWALALSFAGCGGSSTDGATTAAEVAPPLDEAQLDSTWVVAMAKPADFGSFGSAGWVTLLQRRDYRAAVEQLGSAGGLSAARAHAEAAALFRQAALLSSHALIETYASTPEDSDPVGTAHLLTVAYALTGDLDEARKAAARLDGVADDPTLAWHAPWKTWLAGEAVWPPDLSALPLELPEHAVGHWPQLPPAPHYALAVQGSESTVDMGDPGAMVAAALWHDAVARTAAGDQAGIVDAYRAGYRMPVEGPVPAAGELPMELMFGSEMLSPGDAAFLADLHGAAGAGAVESHKDSSLLAHFASVSRTGGKVDSEKAVDVAASFRQALIARSNAKTDGNAEAHHRLFADIAHVGALRGLALVAEVEGDREVSGILRINALERSEKHARCPVGILSLAAWDAANRYPLRAQDIIHEQGQRYPSLEAARYGLDVMALRVSRERPGETPGM